MNKFPPWLFKPILALAFVLGTFPSVQAAQNSYRVEKVADGVFAALALPGGTATSNALIVDLGQHLVISGAHFTKKATNDLLVAAADISPKPVEAFVLAHHHQGFSFVDFDFPPGKTIVMALQTRQVMKHEVRQLNNQITYFQEGLTLEGTERSLVLTNIGATHSKGDLIAYVPQSKTLFTSDLVYIDSAGFLGDGPLREWVIALEGLTHIDAVRVVPGYGPTGGIEEVISFKNYLKDFLTEVIQHIENGDNLYETLKNFTLPQHANLHGYQVFRAGNIERAYRQLSEREN